MIKRFVIGAVLVAGLVGAAVAVQARTCTTWYNGNYATTTCY